MFTYFVTATFLVCLLGVSEALGERTSTELSQLQTDRATILQLVERFIGSWNHDDVMSFVDLFTDNGELVTSKGTSRSQEEIRRIITEKHPEIFFGTNLAEQVESIRVLDDAWVQVSGRFTLCCIPVLLGMEMSREGRFTLRLVEWNGEWKIERADIDS